MGRRVVGIDDQGALIIASSCRIVAELELGVAEIDVDLWLRLSKVGGLLQLDESPPAAARGDRRYQFHVSASPGMPASQTAAATSARATSERAVAVPRSRPPSVTEVAGDSVSAARTPDQAVPASNQHAPVAGAQSKLNSTQTV